jgi:putative oxidoreductase
MYKTVAILVARLIFGGVFVMAAGFKFAGMQATAGYIASAGFPFALVLAWLAAFFESVLAIAFLTGAFFSEVAIFAALYVLFLGFAFHGPSHWTGNQAEFGFFVDHFTFIAGLLFAAVHGPGQVLVAGRRTMAGRGGPKAPLGVCDREIRILPVETAFAVAGIVDN